MVSLARGIVSASLHISIYDYMNNAGCQEHRKCLLETCSRGGGAFPMSPNAGGISRATTLD